MVSCQTANPLNLSVTSALSKPRYASNWASGAEQSMRRRRPDHDLVLVQSISIADLRIDTPSPIENLKKPWRSSHEHTSSQPALQAAELVCALRDCTAFHLDEQGPGVLCSSGSSHRTP